MWLHILSSPCWCVYVALFGSSPLPSNALPDDGVIVTPKHVGAVLMLFLMEILKLPLRQFTCTSVGE